MADQVAVAAVGGVGIQGVQKMAGTVDWVGRSNCRLGELVAGYWTLEDHTSGRRMGRSFAVLVNCSHWEDYSEEYFVAVGH